MDPEHGNGIEEDVEVETGLLSLLKDKHHNIFIGGLDRKGQILERAKRLVDVEHLTATVGVGMEVTFL